MTIEEFIIVTVNLFFSQQNLLGVKNISYTPGFISSELYSSPEINEHSIWVEINKYEYHLI